MNLRLQTFFLIFFGLASTVQAEDEPFIFDNPSPLLECEQPHYTECMLPCAEKLIECLPTEEEFQQKKDAIQADIDAEHKLCEKRHSNSADIEKCKKEASRFHVKRYVNYLNTIGECMEEGFACSEKCQKKYCKIVLPKPTSE